MATNTNEVKKWKTVAIAAILCAVIAISSVLVMTGKARGTAQAGGTETEAAATETEAAAENTAEAAPVIAAIPKRERKNG